MQRIEEQPARSRDEVKESPIMAREVLKLSKPMAGLETVLTGRTDFFAELAQVVALEVQRLLRYTMLQYAQPRCPEAEQRAEADVQNALGDILSHFGEYVDTALQIVSNHADSDSLTTNVEAQVLAKQLDGSIAHNQQLLKRHEGQEDRIRRLNGLIKQMRVQYYREVENQRDRFRNIIGRYLPDLPTNELKNVLTDLTAVQIFEPNQYYDDDTLLAVQSKTEALQAEFQAERVSLLHQIQVLTEMEAETRHRLKVEKKRGERLQNQIAEMSNMSGVAPPEGKEEEDELKVLDTKDMELKRLTMPLPSDSPSHQDSTAPMTPKSPGNRDVHKKLTEKVNHLEKTRKVLHAEAVSVNDLLDKQCSWLDSLLKPHLAQEISVLKVMTKEVKDKCSTILRAAEEDPVDLNFDEAKEKQLNEIKVMKKDNDLMRIELEGLKTELASATAKKMDLESDLQQRNADLEYTKHELQSAQAKVEGLQAVEKPKTETLKHANTTLKILKMMKWNKAGKESPQPGLEEEPETSEELTSLNPQSIDQKISELVENEAKRYAGDFDTMKRQLERAQSKFRTLEDEKVELQRRATRLEGALEEEQQARKSRIYPELDSLFSADESLRRNSIDSGEDETDGVARDSASASETDKGSASRRFSRKTPKKHSKLATSKMSICIDSSACTEEGGKEADAEISSEMSLRQARPSLFTPIVIEAGCQTVRTKKKEQEISAAPEMEDQECQAGTARGRKKHGPHDCEAVLDWNVVQQNARPSSSPRGADSEMKRMHENEVQELKEEIEILREQLAERTRAGSKRRGSTDSGASKAAIEAPGSPSIRSESVRFAPDVPGSGHFGTHLTVEDAVHTDDKLPTEEQPVVPRRRSKIRTPATSLSVVLDDVVEKVELEDINFPSDEIFLPDGTDDKRHHDSAEEHQNHLRASQRSSYQPRASTRASQISLVSEGVFSQVGLDLQEEHRKIKNELRVEYEACLREKIQKERGRLYRAWPRVASADPKKEKLHERLGKRKTLQLELDNATNEVMDFRNEALQRIDAARMMSYSRTNESTYSATDARVHDLRELLESQELFSHYECIGSLTRRLMACRGEFIRMRSRLAGSLFEMDRLRLEMNLQREEFMKRNCDFEILWRRQSTYLSMCSKLLKRTGSRVPIPPALLRNTFDGSTVTEVLQAELAAQGRGAGETGRADFEGKLAKRLRRARHPVLTNMRALMLETQLKAFQMADALFVFHKIQAEEPGVKPNGKGGGFLDLKDLKNQFKDISSLPEAAQRLKMALRMTFQGDKEFLEKAPTVLQIMDHVEDREQKMHEAYHECFSIEVGDEPPRRQFEETIDVAIQANKYLDNADYEFSEAAIEEAREPVSDSTDEENGNESKRHLSKAQTEDSLRIDVADAVAASLRRAERRWESEDAQEASEQPAMQRGMSMNLSKMGYLKEAIKSNFVMHSRTSRKLKAIIDLARAKKAVMETSSVISEVEDAMHILGTQGFETQQTPRQKKANKAASKLEKMEPAKAAEMVMKLDTEERGLTMDAMSTRFRLAMLCALPAVIAGMSNGKKKELQKNYEQMTGKSMPETEEEVEEQIAEAKRKLAEMEAKEASQSLQSIKEDAALDIRDLSEPIPANTPSVALSSEQGDTRQSNQSVEGAHAEVDANEQDADEDAESKRKLVVPREIHVNRTLPATVPHGLWETGDPIAEEGPSLGFFNDTLTWASALPTLPTPSLLQTCSHPLVGAKPFASNDSIRKSNANAKTVLKAKFESTHDMPPILEDHVEVGSDENDADGRDNRDQASKSPKRETKSLTGAQQHSAKGADASISKDDGEDQLKQEEQDKSFGGGTSQKTMEPTFALDASDAIVDSGRENLQDGPKRVTLKSQEGSKEAPMQIVDAAEQDRRVSASDDLPSQIASEESPLMRKAKSLMTSSMTSFKTASVSSDEEQNEVGGVNKNSFLQQAKALKVPLHVDMGTQTTASMHLPQKSEKPRNQNESRRKRRSRTSSQTEQERSRRQPDRSEQGSDNESSMEEENYRSSEASQEGRSVRRINAKISKQSNRLEQTAGEDKDCEESKDQEENAQCAARTSKKKSTSGSWRPTLEESESTNSETEQESFQQSARQKVGSVKANSRQANRQQLQFDATDSEDEALPDEEEDEDEGLKEQQRQVASTSSQRSTRSREPTHGKRSIEDAEMEEMESGDKTELLPKQSQRKRSSKKKKGQRREAEPDEARDVEIDEEERQQKQGRATKNLTRLLCSDGGDADSEVYEETSKHDEIVEQLKSRPIKKVKSPKSIRSASSHGSSPSRSKLSSAEAKGTLADTFSDTFSTHLQKFESQGSSRNSTSPASRSGGGKALSHALQGVEDRFKDMRPAEPELLTVQQLAAQMQHLGRDEMTELFDLVPNWPKMVKVRALSGHSLPSLPGSGRSSRARISLPSSPIPGLQDSEHEMPALPGARQISELLDSESEEEPHGLVEEPPPQLPLEPKCEVAIAHHCSQCDTIGKMSVYCLSCGSCGSKCSECGGDMEVGAFDPQTNLWCCQGCWLKKAADDADYPCPFRDDAMAMAPRSQSKRITGNVSGNSSPLASRSQNRHLIPPVDSVSVSSLRAQFEEKHTRLSSRQSDRGGISLGEIVNSGSKPHSKIETGVGDLLTPNAHINEKKSAWEQVFAHLQRAGKKVEIVELSHDLKRVRKKIREFFSKYMAAIASEEDLYKRAYADALEAYKAQENALGRAVYGDTLGDIDLAEHLTLHPHVHSDEDEPQLHSQLLQPSVERFMLPIAGARPPAKLQNAAMHHYKSSKERKNSLKDSWIIQGQYGEEVAIVSNASRLPRRWQKRHAVQYDPEDDPLLQGRSGSDEDELDQKALASILFQGRVLEVDTDNDEGLGHMPDRRPKKMWLILRKLILRQMLGCFRKLQMSTVLPPGRSDQIKAPRGNVRPFSDKTRKKAAKLEQAFPPPQQESYVGAVSWNYRKLDVQPAAEPEPEAPIVVIQKPKEPWTQERAESMIRALVDPREFMAGTCSGQRSQQLTRHGFQPELRQPTHLVAAIAEVGSAKKVIGMNKLEDMVKAAKESAGANENVNSEKKIPSNWLPLHGEKSSDVSLPQISPRSPNKGFQKQGGMRTPRDTSKLGGIG